MRRAPAIVRRLLPHRLALAAAALTVVLAATVLAALAAFSATVSSHAVRTSLAGNSGTTISVTATVDSAATVPRVSGRLRTSLPSALGGAPVTTWGAASSDYLDFPRGIGLPNAQTHLISLTALYAHAVLVAGSWPTVVSGSAAVPAAVPVGLARLLHLAAGQRLRLHESVSGGLVNVRITGIFRPLQPGSPYWLLGSASGGVQQSGGFADYGPLVTTPAAMVAGHVPVAAAAWAAVPDVARLGAGDLQTLAGRLQSALNNVSGMGGLQNQAVATGLPGLLSGLGTALVVARSQLAIGAAILLVIAGATLALATVMLSSQRQAEAALLRSRGASRWQLAGTGLAEAVLLVLPAVIAGPLLAGLLLPPLARHGPLSRSGLRLPVAFPAAAWLAAAVVAAGCLVVIALPWLRAAGSPVRERAQRGRRGALAAATRAGADLGLLAARRAGRLAARALRRPGIDGPERLDRHRPDPGQRARAGPGRRGGHPAAAAAARGQARRPRGQPGPRHDRRRGGVADQPQAAAPGRAGAARGARGGHHRACGGAVEQLAALGAGPGQLRHRGRRACRSRTAGAAPAEPGGRADPHARGHRQHAGHPVVDHAAEFGRGNAACAGHTAGRVGRGDTAGPGGRVATGAARPALAGRDVGRAGSAVGVSGRAGSRPARLEITASLRARSVGQPVLFVNVTDAFGIPYQLQAGVLPGNGASTTLIVPVAPGNEAAYPLHITGFSLQYVMPTTQVPEAVLSITSVRGAATMTADFGAPFAAAAAGGQLASSVTAGSGEVSAPPVVTHTATSGTSLTVSFQPGNGIIPSQFGVPASTLPASISVASPAPVATLPAAATSAFAAATGQGLGSSFPIQVDNTTVRVTIVSVIAGFPTVGPAGGIVVDQGLLQQMLAASGTPPQPVTEWWLRTAGAAPTRLPGGTQLTDRASLAASLLANPLGAAPQLAMLAIAAAAVVLAAAGFAVAAATAGERARDLALLAALGATRRQLTRLLCLEQAALGIPAAVAGLALGGVLARLVVPAVTLTATGAHPEPAVLVQVPLAVPVAVALATAAVPVVIAALGPARRAGLAARTRLEAET